jgi:hypothetical protein
MDIIDEIIQEIQAEDAARARELEEYLNTGLLEEGEEPYIPVDYNIDTPVPGTPHPFETPANLDRDYDFENLITDYFDFQESNN